MNLNLIKFLEYFFLYSVNTIQYEFTRKRELKPAKFYKKKLLIKFVYG